MCWGYVLFVEQLRVWHRRNPTRAQVSVFNPYREWLGIQASGSITCYQLLGVKRQDSPEQIRTRAEQLVQQLRRVDASGHEDQRDQLLEKIKLAATILMDAERREAYDRKLAAKKAAKRRLADQEKKTKKPGPAPTKPATKTSAQDPRAKKKKKRIKPQPVRHDGEKNVTDELMRLRPRRQDIAPAYATDRRRSKAFSFSMMLGALSVLGIGYLLFTQTPWGYARVAQTQPTQDQDQPPITKTEDQDSSSSVSQAENESHDAPGQPVPAFNTSTQFVEAAHTANSASATQDQLAMGDMVFTSTKARNPHRAKVMALFSQARQLLGERKTKLAKGKLEKARPYTSDTTTQLMLGRLETLTNYVEAYWKAAEDQLNSFEAGDEAQIGGQSVMVVERTEEQIVLRIAGKNRTIDRREEQPIQLAMKLADTWFDEDAASTKVFRGAMMAVTPEFDSEDARALWREAEASGEINLGDLEQVLDDQYE